MNPNSNNIYHAHNTHFVSDTHFNHKNIIEYSKRPFRDIVEMTDAMIKEWNRVVKPGDNVFHLGDFAMGDRKQIPSIVPCLNGQIHLIFGNHDEAIQDFYAYERLFASVQTYLEIKVQDQTLPTRSRTQRIVLFHFPIGSWNKAHHGAWHAHGHCHGTYPTPDTMFRLDVGVDATADRLGHHRTSYRPISYLEVKAHMATKKFEPVDHHGTHMEL